MTFWVAVILGLIQGLTEFFPVSSSGHLALVGMLAGLREADLTFDILVHLATLAAILAYFRHDWRDIARMLIRREETQLPPRVVAYLGVATLPAVVVGLLIKHQVERLHQDPFAVGCFLLVTAAVLLLGFRFKRQGVRYREMTWSMAVVMGLAQVLAILPGVSRSGITIMAGIFMGLDRSASARFSFLMAVPVIGGAGTLAVADLLDRGLGGLSIPWGPYLAGSVVALVAGFIALKFLMRLLTGHRFFHFGIYCMLVGLVAIGWGLSS